MYILHHLLSCYPSSWNRPAIGNLFEPGYVLYVIGWRSYSGTVDWRAALFRYVQIFVTYARDGHINPKWVFVENFVAFVGVSRNVTAPLNVSETLRYQMPCNSIHCSPVTAGQIRSMATVTVSVVTFHANAPQIMEPVTGGTCLTSHGFPFYTHQREAVVKL